MLIPQPLRIGAPVGAVAEVSPSAVSTMRAIAERIDTTGGAALVVDYGHADHRAGATLQAVRRHQRHELREERTDEAVAIARAYADDGGGPRALRALADLYRSMERYGEAEPIYSELIDSSGDDGDWRLYFARATTRERQGRWSEAEADLQRALELAPDQPDVLNYLGYTWVDRGERLQEGLAMIERAVEARPSSGAIIDSLGWAHFRLGDFETALNLLERAVALSPADPVLNDHLGDAYWRVGRRTEARFQWRRALSLDPAEAERTLIEVKLEDGLPAIPETRSATR
jgi:Flp pilus assembly protein TadD